MNIALIQLPHFFGSGQSRPPECYPLGLGYLSSVLSLHGISHQGVDLWGKQYSVPDALGNIDFSPFDVLGISAYSTQYRYLKEFTLQLKLRYPGKTIICGGPGPTFSSEAILRHTGVDICVLGEGETTLIELLGKLSDPAEVAGIAFIRAGELYRSPARPSIPDLDRLPLPNRTLFDFEQILANAEQVRSGSSGTGKKRRAADIIAGRGCPYSCHYCSRTFSGVRLRSVDNLVGEIVSLKEVYRIDHLQFNDELLLVGRDRSLAICRELKKLDITWSAQGRINQVDRELLAAMKESGCVQIGYGVESISQTLLDGMNKNLRAETIIPAIRMTREAGITPLIQYMYGYPGENEETIAATARFFREIDAPYHAFTTTPIPGTRLYQDCLEKGLIGSEEGYLLRLDSGYNLEGALINMTGFSDQEFLARKRRLFMTVTHHYLKKRPLAYARYLFGLSGRMLRGCARRALQRIAGKGGSL